VLTYKRKRHIINPSYQTAPDNIVSIKTIAAMDRQLNALPCPPMPTGVQKCTRLYAGESLQRRAVQPRRT